MYFLDRKKHPQRSCKSALLLLVALHVLILLFATEAQARTCPLGTFDNGSRCKKCKPGTFQDKLGSTSCKKCPAGTFTSSKGVVSRELCLECPRDSTSKPGSRKCIKCPRGKVRDSCAKCIRCPPGTSLSQCECVTCFKTSFTNKANQEFCSPCPPGMRANEARTGCIEGGCPPGFQFDGSCIPCNIAETEYRTFKNETTGLCEPCPKRTTILDFSKPAVKCEKCPPGMFLTDIIVSTDFGVPVCEKCPPGSTTLGFGKPLCRENGKPCPDHTFEDEDGDCQACDPDFRFDSKNKKCVECKRNEVLPGYPNPAYVQTKCRRCAPGQIRYLGRCVCPDGKVFRKGRCRPCPAGTSSILGNDCIPCGSDYFSVAGASECERCPEGSVSVESNGRKCKRVRCGKGLIQAPFLTSDFPANICVSPATGCPKELVGLGFKAERFVCGDKKGNVVCPKGLIFDGRDQCISCFTGWRIAKTKRGTLTCRSCPFSKPVSDGGLTRKCRACKKGFQPNSTASRCKCVGFLKGGRCVECPPMNDPKAPTKCLFLNP